MKESKKLRISTVFKNGPSTQAVRIPKEYRLDTSVVWIEKVHGGLLIRPKPSSWNDFFGSDQLLSDDFDLSRNQKPPKKRDDIF